MQPVELVAPQHRVVRFADPHSCRISERKTHFERIYDLGSQDLLVLDRSSVGAFDCRPGARQDSVLRPLR